MIRNPRFDTDELDVIKRQVVTSLQKSTTEPQALAPREVNRILSPYQPDDIRYVQTIDEEIAMYGSVQVDQIKSLHDNFLSNQKGELAMVGDFDLDEVKQLIKDQLTDFDSEIAYARVDRDPHPEIAGQTELIETPDKANAFMFSSQRYSLADDSPEYASLVLGNYILGGGSLSSRLGNRVRQKEGLSYTVRSSVSPRTKDTRVDFILYAITNPQNKDKLMDVMMEEIDLLRAKGITADELSEAKTAYLQAAKVRRASDAALAGELLSSMFNERTMAYHVKHEEQIEAATIDSVNAAIQKFIVPDKLVVAIAGDFANAEEPEKETEEL